MAKQKQDDQHEHTYSSYVRIRDVALKTCQRQVAREGQRYPCWRHDMMMMMMMMILKAAQHTSELFSNKSCKVTVSFEQAENVCVISP